MGLCGADEPVSDQGLKESRRCTDVLFCLIFALFWVGMVIIGATALSEGDPNLLYYGFDSSGYLCGTGNKLWPSDAANATTNATVNTTATATGATSGPSFSSRKVLYYLDVKEYQTMALIPAKSVCMDACPTKTISEGLSASSFVCTYYGKSGITGLSGVDAWDVQYYDKLSASQKLSSLVMAGPCYPVFVGYSPILNRCVPRPSDAQLSALTASADLASTGLDSAQLTTALNAMSGNRDLLQDYLEDLIKAWVVIVVAGFLGGLIFSIIWMFFLRYFSGCMAWVTVLMTNLILIALTVYCGMKAGLIGDDTVGVSYITASTNTTLSGASASLGVDTGASEDAAVFEIATYIMAALTVLAFLFTLLMIRRIMIAVACLKVASQAIAAMPMILFMPALPMLMNVVFLAWSALVAVFLYASGTVTKTGDNVSIKWDETLQYMSLYHLFGIFWTTQFIAGFGIMVTAGSIATFYWNRAKMPANPIRASLARTTKYHLGSIALGSFIVAVVQFVRVMLEYIDSKTKRIQEGNPLVKYLMCCVKYCMWYLEKVLKFINRNAYILVAVKGYSYCYSAFEAVKLIVLNALRMAAVNTVGDFLTWLGKLVVAGICGFIAFLLCDTDMYTDPTSSSYLTSPLLPVIVVIFIAYCEADVFLSVYEMAVDTILLSFCEDCGASGGPHYAPPLLMSALGKTADPKVKPSQKD
eukprot:CAMPEP_0197577324 /NCGR_PEP_ID=MMETSP1326-20131121/1998_1 /TAXON_ID=1155430 /ORGANISM="Genus nov. species nov., Strain RCC2288" /LENGTH=699 /DNA_ID=CAMNT_0043140379 /DNA_START=89 /DNA_END=2188 /DNA_ORIENTATION=+